MKPEYMPYPWIEMGYKITVKKGKIVKVKPYKRENKKMDLDFIASAQKNKPGYNEKGMKSNNRGA